MNKHKALLAGAVLLTGCTELTHLGVSGEVSPIRSEDSAQAVARHYTTLTFAPGETLVPYTTLGDVDGDGIDDLLVGAYGPEDEGEPGQVGDMTAYLFYGRAQLPQQLTYADADATFDTGVIAERIALGDVNADGLADFALGDGTGYEIVFGSPARYSGHHAKLSTGHVLQYGAPPPEGGQLPVRFYRVVPVGDVNGDGADDFLVQVTVEADNHLKVELREYLIEGRTGAWPSGPWDWSNAAALFGADRPGEEALTVVMGSSGDIDGDGYSDLIARANERYWVFYGGPDGLHGTLTPSVADAVFEEGVWIVGDIDGDGADDLQTAPYGSTGVVYGSATRYSGSVTLQADLVFPGQGCSLNVGDFNGDGLNDLLVHATPTVEDWTEGDPVPASATYELRGTGTRLTGDKQLLASEIYRPVGYALPTLLNGAGFGSYGDLDGDGSTDLLGVQLRDPDLNVDGLIYILPGSTPAPD